MHTPIWRLVRHYRDHHIPIELSFHRTRAGAEAALAKFCRAYVTDAAEDADAIARYHAVADDYLVIIEGRPWLKCIRLFASPLQDE